jgi:hypothetical protein
MSSAFVSTIKTSFNISYFVRFQGTCSINITYFYMTLRYLYFPTFWSDNLLEIVFVVEIHFSLPQGVAAYFSTGLDGLKITSIVKAGVNNHTSVSCWKHRCAVQSFPLINHYHKQINIQLKCKVQKWFPQSTEQSTLLEETFVSPLYFR